MKLTSTQIGAIAENLVANELMIESAGRLSPFQPVADDDGIDLLIYDKVTGKSAPIQIKARTNTIYKPRTKVRGNIAHFSVRKSTFNDERNTLLLCVLLNNDLRSTARAWLIPMDVVSKLSRQNEKLYIIRASKLLTSNDKYSPYQCKSINEVMHLLLSHFEK